MEQYNIPIALFTFKRIEKLLIILDRISKIRPRKIYIISDGGRTSEEQEVVNDCRSKIEARIDWNCEIIKKYASENIGVYQNISGGAKWVLGREKYAIFLEDDNLPDLSFFPFCEELLRRYEDDSRILWICGTNYLKEYQPPDDSSYLFTQHMLPCGWASWSNKFEKFYDGELSLWRDSTVRKRVKELNYYSLLMKQDQRNWDRELRLKENNKKFYSWDYQMSFSLRAHGLYGITPRYNQIENIGVDMDSIHGGTTFDNIMTRRFCGLPTQPINFPLKHPKIVQTDLRFERLTAKIITLPLQSRMKGALSRFFKKIVSINQDASFTGTLRNKLKK